MRPIDADALMKWANDHYDFEVYTVGYISDIIKDSPTVDAELVIRCKDCKYWTQNPFGGKVGFCNKHKDIAIACDETDFCSWAERKEK